MTGLPQIKKILIITSGQPSLNPRLVKEADALSDAGYQVTVLYAYWNSWGTKFDRELIPTKKWKAICVGGDPERSPFLYFLSRLIHKIANIVSRKTHGKYLAEIAIARAAYFLSRKAKKHQADLYIGHNLGALSATINAAKANRKPCGFDAEDFHRFETSNNLADVDVLLKINLENRYLPHINYLTASSPFIAEAYQQLFPYKNPVIVLNSFPRNLTIHKPVLNEDRPIKLLWFSQTIGPKRGIEDIVNALYLLTDYRFELHLLGYLSKENKVVFADNLIGNKPVSIHFHEPLNPSELSFFSSQFDIGLALEPAFSINNDIALSNKIFTYLQAGLCVIGSDTRAHCDFWSQYPAIGKIYKKGDPQALAGILLYYYQRRDKLFECRKAAFKASNEQLNWENESKGFLKLIAKILDIN
jgi:glycosyltransferase involved in cell wall biosynthesis